MAEEIPWEDKALTSQKEKQLMYHRWKIFDEEQDGFMKTDVGIFLFGPVELPDKKNPPTLNHYHELYSPDQRETIDTIITQIRGTIPGSVAFGYTFLTARVPESNDLREYLIFRFATEITVNRLATKTTVDDVFFIEPSSRVYQNWTDFIESNKLPYCTYMAPDDGIYKPEGEIKTYTSPEANRNVVLRHVDKVLTVTGVGLIGASIFSVAPLITTCAGVSVCAYSTIQSVQNLYDRYMHSESIMPTNLEAFSNHLTIVTVGFTGLSSAALAYRSQITSKFGKWAPTLLRTMNIGALSLDACGLAFNSYVFYEKWKISELTYMDTFNLLLQIYLLHGQISNSIEVHKMLSSTSTAHPRRLTKTQKRNLRRRRAKAAKRGQVYGQQNSSSTVKITDGSGSGDTFQSMMLIASCIGGCTVDFLRKHYPREQVIIEFLTDIKLLISKLWNEEIDSCDFFLNLSLHISNLMQILQIDIDSLKRFCSMFGFEPDVNAAGATYNGVQKVNDCEDLILEELDRMMQQIPGGLYEPSAPEYDLTDSEPLNESVAQDDGIMKQINVEVILNAVERLISKCKVDHNSAMLSVFAEGVKYIRSVIVTNMLEIYELALSVNMALLNDRETAAKALIFLGVVIGDHFFPTHAALLETLSEAVEKVEQFVDVAEYATGVQREEDSDNETNAVFARISQSIRSLFELLVPTETGLGLEKTLDTLEYVSNFYITEKLVEFNQKQTVADQVFQANVRILDHAKASQILANLGLSVDPRKIALQIANAELDDTQLCNLLENCSSVASAKSIAVDEAINSSETCEDFNIEDNFLITLAMNTCCEFMKKIKPLDCATNDPQKLLVKVLHFILTKFAQDTSNLKEQFQQLSCNLDILGPAKYKTFLEKLKACPQKNRSTLLSTSELLMAFGDDVVSEYFELFDDGDQLENVKLWELSADEEGLQVKSTKNCRIDLSHIEFRDLARSLFLVNVDPNCLVEKHKNLVYLKSREYVITFSLDEESKSWLVILADRRVNQLEV